MVFNFKKRKQGLNYLKTLNIKQSLKNYKEIPTLPIIAVTGSTMDVGKTTMICKIVNHFIGEDLKVVGAKLTGVAFLQDIYKVTDSGAIEYLSFLDAGLPSTCGSKEDAIQSTYMLLNKLAEHKPDLVILEFGDGLMGKYHVQDILLDKNINKNIKVHINASSDICAVNTCINLSVEMGIPLDLITGPVANNDEGVQTISSQFSVLAESNQNDIPKTIKLIKDKLLNKSNEH